MCVNIKNVQKTKLAGAKPVSDFVAIILKRLRLPKSCRQNSPSQTHKIYRRTKRKEKQQLLVSLTMKYAILFLFTLLPAVAARRSSPAPVPPAVPDIHRMGK